MRTTGTRTHRPGSTGPRLLLGTAQIGQHYGIANQAGRPDRGTVEAIVQTARERGVTHLDTARAYGCSETDLGAAAPAGQEPSVVTKILPLDGPDPAETLGRSWTESRKALGEKAIDVTDLLLHRAADAGKPGVWEALRRIRDTHGLARIGVSVQHPDELLAVLDLPDLEHVQLPLNVLDRRWIAPEITGALVGRPDVVVVARSVFLQGLLTTDTAWPRGHDGAAVLRALDLLTAPTGSTSRAALCVRFALSHPWVDAVVIGAENAGQVAQNAALAMLPPLSENTMAEVLEHLPAGAPDLVDPSRWQS